MNITVKAKDLVEFMKLERKINKKKCPLPILNNVLMTVKKQSISEKDIMSGEKITGDILVVSSTNLDLSVSMSMDCVADVEGKIIVPTEYLKNIKSKDKDVVITENSVSYGDFSTNFKPISVEDFPSLPPITFGRGDLLSIDGLAKCLSFVSNDKNKYSISGVYVCNEGYMATDGRRLMWCKTKTNNQTTGFILSPELLKVVIAFSSNSGMQLMPVVVDKEKNTCTFFCDNKITITGKTIDGTFPNFKNVIPKQEDAIETFSVNVLSLSNILKNVIGVVDKESPCTIFDFDITNNITNIGKETTKKLNISNRKNCETNFQTTDLWTEIKWTEPVPVKTCDNCKFLKEHCIKGEGEAGKGVEVDCCGFVAKPYVRKNFGFAINPMYLKDICDACSTQNPEVYYYGETGAVMFKNGDDELFLCMPVRR